MQGLCEFDRVDTLALAWHHEGVTWHNEHEDVFFGMHQEHEE